MCKGSQRDNCKQLLKLAYELSVSSPRQQLGQHLGEYIGWRQQVWLFFVHDLPSPLRMDLCHSQHLADWTVSGWLLWTMTWQGPHQCGKWRSSCEMCCVQGVLARDKLPRGARVEAFFLVSKPSSLAESVGDTEPFHYDLAQRQDSEGRSIA